MNLQLVTALYFLKVSIDFATQLKVLGGKWKRQGGRQRGRMMAGRGEIKIQSRVGDKLERRERKQHMVNSKKC
jgi:hypothetical protein